MITVFKRSWWKDNNDWPDGLEPCMGTKFILTRVETEGEARTFCRAWNNSHRPGRYSTKAEF